MRPPSYVGITGFMSRDEVKAALLAFPQHSPYKLMAGVLVSDHSLLGKPGNPARYPMPEELRTIFVGDPRALNILHLNIHEESELFDCMVKAQSMAGHHCHGFQLNIAWPKVQTLKQYRATFSKKVVVLQCGAHALEAVGNSPTELAKRVREYGDLIDYVLLDQSGGRGLDLDLSFMNECFTELEKQPRLGLVMAGGIRPHNVFRLHGIRQKFGASIDTESGVRVADTMQLSLVENYLKQSTDNSNEERVSTNAQ